MNETLTARKLITTREAAEYLDVSVQTFYGWRADGTGPRAIRVGRHLRFDPADLAAWLEQRKDPA